MLLAAEAPLAPPAPTQEATTSYERPLPWGLHHVTGALNALGTVWILALMVLVNVDVFGRNLLNKPLIGVPEILALSIVGIVFLQLPDTLRMGKITRADLVLDRLRVHRPALFHLLHAAFHALGAILLVIITWASWAPLAESVRIREFVGNLGVFQAPVWPIRLITLIGLVLTTLCYLLLMACDLRAWMLRRRGA